VKIKVVVIKETPKAISTMPEGAHHKITI